MTVTSTISTNKYVLYLRISTAKSGGVDSNGIAAQERDLNLFLGTKDNPEVVGKFVEVMSGACNERPQLEKALKLCRRTNSTLVVQKVDRLSRDVEFIARLIKDKSINLAVANLPNADSFQIHLFAAISQKEREFISLRTKSALREWKAKNPHRKLGNPNLHEINKVRKHKSRKFNVKVANVILPLRKQGFTFKKIAEMLNEMKLSTAEGKEFHKSQVKRIVDRALVEV